MSNDPAVSILIPAHNAGGWIWQAIDSALNQRGVSLEVVVLDDGSTDDTACVIESFGQRIRYEIGPNQGANAARNRLLELARGEWVNFLDADDYLLPGKIRGQLAAADGADVIYSPTILRDENTGTETPVVVHAEPDPWVHYIQWRAFCTHGLLLRRQAVADAGGWRVLQPACQEHELLLRLLMAHKRFRFHASHESVYRIHGRETVSRRDPLRTIRLRMELTDRAEAFLSAARRLTAAHKRELYAARLGAARSAYMHDEETATRLARQSLQWRPWWIQGSPALPVSYQVAFRLLGFHRAEQVAAMFRTQLAGHNKSASSGYPKLAKRSLHSELTT